MYQVIFLPSAEESFRKFDKTVQKRIAAKIDWLAENADKVIHYPLKSLPDDLHGLCRIRSFKKADIVIDFTGCFLDKYLYVKILT
jgi:mRNA-degrading endonuclease RelE of RelBE toxin-antitoxin system